jgi:GDPmannose 4,6-dehydratase
MATPFSSAVIKVTEIINMSAPKIALIFGISGQDGSYLAKFLLDKGYIVWGTSRDVQGHSFGNLLRLDIRERIKLLSVVTEDFRSVYVALNTARPDEVYFLAGQSSVGLSFEQPAETMQSMTFGALNILEACRLVDHPIKIYHAGSSECFGNISNEPANENTSFNPRSPYAVAKASAHWLVSNYREAYSLYCCTGILFNHESPLRPTRFVTQKIINSAKRIAAGSKETLLLGRLDIRRDWGWAPDYIEAMWLILQQKTPEDYIVATGVTHSLQDFVSTAFNQHGLDWTKHVKQDPSLFRPTDLLSSEGNPEKAYKNLGWKAKTSFNELISLMSSNKLFSTNT